MGIRSQQRRGLEPARWQANRHRCGGCSRPGPVRRLVCPAYQGLATALSSDGSTALVGGPGDGGFNTRGAAWVFTQPRFVIMTHPGNFTQGQNGALYTIRIGVEAASSGMVSVTGTLATGLTATAIN